MKATRYYFSNGQNTICSIADTLEEATLGVAEGYKFNGQTARMEYKHARFAEDLLKAIGGNIIDNWKTKPTVKDWTDTGFILYGEDENSPEFEFSFHDGKVAIQYRVPKGADGRTLYDPDPLPTIRISTDKPMKRIVSELNSRLWVKALVRHGANRERVCESRQAKQTQEDTLKAIRQLFGKGPDGKGTTVQIGGSLKGWFGDAWVMGSSNVRINIDSIDSTRALKILKFISEL